MALEGFPSPFPSGVLIEALAGEECDLAARHPAVYGSDYCANANADAAKAATGLDVPAAIAEVSQTLKAWPAQPTPAQRRHLASRFLAANDRGSAYVQWLQLPDAERRAGDGLDAALVAMFNQIATRNNENYQIAARLAARLGLQQVHAVDNHTGDNIDVADGQAFGQAIEQAWKAGRARRHRPRDLHRDAVQSLRRCRRDLFANTWLSGDAVAHTEIFPLWKHAGAIKAAR